MKKILLFLFISSFAFAQELVINSKGDSILLDQNRTWSFKNEKTEAFLTVNDFKNSKTKNDTGTLITKIVSTKDGANNNVKIDFSVIINEELLQKYGTSYFNTCTEKLLISTKYTLKNKYTFIPREVGWYFSKDEPYKDKWMVAIYYSAQNDYGALKDGKNLIVVDNECKEL